MAWLICLLLLGLPADDLEAARKAVDAREFTRAVRLLDTFLEAEEGHLEARYLRGIALRELGRNPTLEARLKRYLRRGAEDFERVLEQDSTYQDVLYQYAILKRYDNDLQAAIELGEAQLRHRPDLEYVLPGVLTLYWRYVVETSPADARLWLRSQSGYLTPVFVGKTYERQSFFDAAAEVYEEFLAREKEGPGVGQVPAQLAVARLNFARNRPEDGTDGVLEAASNIRTLTDALVMFDEIKTIATPAEVAEFMEVDRPTDYRGYFQEFWTRRDPMPAAPFNARMAEHYRRLRVAEQHYLFYGFRSWYKSAFTDNAVFFPNTYSLSHDFDDRGVVFIRHGEPDDYTHGESNSWLYYDSLLVFHFAPTCHGVVCGVKEHFVPTPRGETFASGIVGSDPFEMEQRSLASLAAGLSSDRHTWPTETRHWDVPYVVAAFRGLDDHSLVEVYYEVPLEETARVDGPDTITIETGFVVHNDKWQRMGYVRERRKYPRGGAGLVDRFQVDLVPASYHIGLHARVVNGVHLAAHRFDYRPRRFSNYGLKVSDVLLADNVEALPDVQSREDVKLHVQPAGVFDASMFVYFEVYDLQLAPDGRTRYRVTYGLVPERGGREAAITLQTDDQRGLASSPIEYVAIDLTEVPKGNYVLEITVTDLENGVQIGTSRPLEVDR